jgi:cell division protein FtsW
MQASSSYLPDLFAWRHSDNKLESHYDVTLLLAAFSLLAIGMIMVTSASMPVAARLFDNPFHFSIRHAIYIVIASIAAIITLMIPMRWWQKTNAYLLFLPSGF